MSPEAKEKRNEYMRKWRANNPDKVKRNFERYWENKAAKESNQIDEWRCQCGRLLGKVHVVGFIEIKCRKCGNTNVYKNNIEALEAL